MKGIYKEIEGNNTVVFIKLLKVNKNVVFIIVKNDYTIYIFPPGVYKLIKMLNLI